MDSATLLLGFAALAVAGGFLYLFYQKSSSNSGTQSTELSERIDSLSQNMTQNMNAVTKAMLDQLNQVTNQVGSRLKENSDRLDNAGKVINDVTKSLSRLEESNKKVYEMAKDLNSLQDILKMPKLRGGLGELFLEELLSQIFSKDQYAIQHRFKSGEIVDAVVKLRDSQMVSVDAKFPLENFKKMIEEKDEKESGRLRKSFVGDVKKHIDDIARKYILPDEGTLDFALMYIPAENVYYETIIKDSADVSISQYGLSKNVIPVSPNSFNIYLHTILMGLRGMQIEKSARDIFNNLSRLKTDFGKFGEDFELVGTHLGRAKNSYEKSEKRLEKFSGKLDQVESSSARNHKSLDAPAGETGVVEDVVTESDKVESF